jgi:DNA-binding MarR family transcriptional regulator
MASEKSQDELVLESLQTLGVALLTEWDALTFVYRHTTSLCTAAQIAKLIGYDKVETAGALQKLETLGLIERSRVAQGIRFYRVPAAADPLRRCLLELMSLTQDRAGRLLLLRHLKRSGPALRRRRNYGLRLA